MGNLARSTRKNRFVTGDVASKYSILSHFSHWSEGTMSAILGAQIFSKKFGVQMEPPTV
jgi:hypothetical protein